MRKIVKIVTSRQMKEGGGFLVRRPIGDHSQSELDPFLLLDHMGPANYGPGEAVGAPDHPHRGFETVTYVVEGGMQHLDSSGGKGSIVTGGVQWMTAGRGVVHAEMPSDEIMKKGGLLEGFQIWVNLPKKDKMTDPRYQDFGPKQIPTKILSDGKSFVKVIAGEFDGVTSPIHVHTPISLFDARLEPNGFAIFKIPRGQNFMVYCYRGAGTCQSDHLKMGQAAVFDFKDDTEGTATITAGADSNMFVLILTGEPIKEPVERYGPFVMNTKEEINQAISDYQSGRLGGKIAGAEERSRQTQAALAAQKKNAQH